MSMEPPMPGVDWRNHEHRDHHLSYSARTGTPVNLIAAGFVDTPLSASLLGDDLEKRRNQLRATLPIGRVVGPKDVAALAVHIMTNTALTGATYDIDGGQQFVAA
jgi:NAD(P)-dependent dehydrogenase (short-subunit alcohol dehydrogenase family)